jgi:hypothetical protein
VKVRAGPSRLFPGVVGAGAGARDTRAGAAGRAARWSAVIQPAGQAVLNVTAFRALQVVVGDPDYDRLVWRPDAFGSICFRLRRGLQQHPGR